MATARKNAFLTHLHGSERSVTLRLQAEAEDGDRDKILRRWQALEREEWYGLSDDVKKLWIIWAKKPTVAKPEGGLGEDAQCSQDSQAFTIVVSSQPMGDSFPILRALSHGAAANNSVPTTDDTLAPDADSDTLESPGSPGMSPSAVLNSPCTSDKTNWNEGQAALSPQPLVDREVSFETRLAAAVVEAGGAADSRCRDITAGFSTFAAGGGQ